MKLFAWLHQSYTNRQQSLVCPIIEFYIWDTKTSTIIIQKYIQIYIWIGFTIDPYDICVANKIINGDNMTVVCHMEDMKICHKIPQEVSVIIEDLKANYQDDIGKISFNEEKLWLLGYDLGLLKTRSGKDWHELINKRDDKIIPRRFVN